MDIFKNINDEETYLDHFQIVTMLGGRVKQEKFIEQASIINGLKVLSRLDYDKGAVKVNIQNSNYKCAVCLVVNSDILNCNNNCLLNNVYKDIKTNIILAYEDEKYNFNSLFKYIYSDYVDKYKSISMNVPNQSFKVKMNSCSDKVTYFGGIVDGVKGSIEWDSFKEDFDFKSEEKDVNKQANCWYELAKRRAEIVDIIKEVEEEKNISL